MRSTHSPTRQTVQSTHPTQQRAGRFGAELHPTKSYDLGFHHDFSPNKLLARVKAKKKVEPTT